MPIEIIDITTITIIIIITTTITKKDITRIIIPIEKLREDEIMKEKNLSR